MPAAPPLEVRTSRHFLPWFAQSDLSLAFTTYQTNRLFLIGLKPDGRLSVFERHFDRPMGLHATAERLIMSSRFQLWTFDNALPPGQQHDGFDRLYVPRQASTTGDLDVHDIAVDRSGRTLFVNTAYSCLATTSERYSFTPLWQPPFVSRLVPEDRCHLNGLALADGVPAYATAVSRSDVVGGWRERRHGGGLVIDVRTGEIVVEDLSMPHSPRMHDGKLWVLNSGSGELGWVDLERHRFEPVAFCPGFLRGLAFAGNFAIVGLSKQRKERTFSGLALDERLKEKDAEARCGLWVIELTSGIVAHWVELEGVVIELYDVQVLPGVKRPMALGFKTDEIQRLITIDQPGRPVFQALSAKPPGAGGPPRANPPRAAAPSATAAEAEYKAANHHLKRGDVAAAIRCYQQALALDPRHVRALANLGAVYQRLGQADAAKECYGRALAIDPHAAPVQRNLALLLQTQGDLRGAIRQYEAALAARGEDADLLNLLGLVLYEDGRLEAAKGCFERATKAAPEAADAYNNWAGVLKVEERLDEALALHEKAITLAPDFAVAHENIGKIHDDRGRIAEARTAYGRALALRHDPVLELHRELLCPPVFASLEALDRYRAHAEAVVDGLAGREIVMAREKVQSSRAEPPFDWAYHGRDNLALKRRYAALFAPGFSSPPLARRPSASGPWRIGFVVTAGHEGVFARCMGGILNHLDASRFETFVILSRARAGALRGAVRNTAIRFINLPLRFDHAVARLQAAALDAIYYWEVGTDSTNYFLPFLRLAPLQCTGWGWPETSAAPEIDHHLTSAALALPDTDARFSERLVRLPELPPYFYPPPIPSRPHPPSHFGLPSDAHVYLCAQTLRKMHPDLDALIGGILRRDRRGVAVFVADAHPAHGELLQDRWRETLPDVLDRVVLLPRLPPEDYFHLVAGAHVSLDPLYFGGANTAYDSLAAGVPMVTLPTELPRGRYVAALLRRVGAEECIARTPEDYVERAVALGGDAALRDAVGARIRAQAPAVFETRAAVEQLERYFADALAGLTPRGAVP
jgi:uncharacterized protein (TIGR03032 family)